MVLARFKEIEHRNNEVRNVPLADGKAARDKTRTLIQDVLNANRDRIHHFGHLNYLGFTETFTDNRHPGKVAEIFVGYEEGAASQVAPSYMVNVEVAGQPGNIIERYIIGHKGVVTYKNMLTQEQHMLTVNDRTQMHDLHQLLRDVQASLKGKFGKRP